MSGRFLRGCECEMPSGSPATLYVTNSNVPRASGAVSAAADGARPSMPAATDKAHTGAARPNDFGDATLQFVTLLPLCRSQRPESRGLGLPGATPLGRARPGRDFRCRLDWPGAAIKWRNACDCR